MTVMNRMIESGNRTGGIALGLLALATGCARIDAPTGYVEVKNVYGYDYKAVSAQGNVFALTSRDNPAGEGDQTFWSQAVEHQKVAIDGYRLEGREEIKSESGLGGTLFDLRVGSGSAEYTYLLALYVSPRTIYTVEAGGPSKRIEADRAAISRAMTTLRP